MDGIVNVDDLRRAAKRRLPKIAFDFIEGGVEDEDGLNVNEQAFRQHRLVPRYLVDVSTRDQSAPLFGRTYASPFGIAPTGLASLFRPGADLMLAAAAREANVPFIMSGSSTASIEDLAKVAPDHGWYQLYAARDKKISEDMIRRAEAAGLSTLVLTVDVPVHSNRERNQRNGFTRPLKLSWGTKLEALRHPGWLAGYLKQGTPMFSNWAPYVEKGASADAVAAFVASQTAAPLTWRDVESFRRLWPRKFVIKGIMHSDDAVRAASLGVDGIMVSNHGARQLDRAPSPVDVLPAIRDAVGDRLTLMLDSGVRRGVDALTALCLGAKFVFVGRATLYGATVGGQAGVTKAINILRREIDLTMGQIGCPSLDHLGPDFLLREREEDWRRNQRS
ncbi:alpha-hydroxy acid oxidase [Reyranella sp. CPCC 100927]|uniref:alpha-hydroxy acid oxidase n=1 Tax=Reyranella sp. CPCC 100927 TaxID=2599616 RepID=UPI0011B77CB9|nr:alpha-hydroxy acid oxidase [Reyranella sp. CPCC 100927]TWT06047.1 alpha-hydroxy-acid oxidizing protein [Reyranella sp. CPCC 100927]